MLMGESTIIAKFRLGLPHPPLNFTAGYLNMLLIVLISIVMGIVPMLIYATLLWWLDRWEKEPIPLLVAAFLWGFIPSAIGALVLQLILDIPVSAVFYYKDLGY